MARGPCMCGDPYCGSCYPGNDGGASESAIEGAAEQLAESELRADEIPVAVTIGIAAVLAMRQHGKVLIGDAVIDASHAEAVLVNRIEDLEARLADRGAPSIEPPMPLPEDSAAAGKETP